MRRIRLISAAACGIFVLAAGCGSQNPSGSGSTTTTAPTTSSSPSVPNPLSLAALTSNPCNGLSATQLAPYLGTVRKADPSPADGSDGPSCDYFPADLNEATISISTLPSFGGPANLGQAGVEWSERTVDISGYPAEHVSLGGPTGPQNGECGTVVVVSDQAAFEVHVQTSDSSYRYYSNLCTVSDALAPDVITYLKSGG